MFQAEGKESAKAQMPDWAWGLQSCRKASEAGAGVKGAVGQVRLCSQQASQARVGRLGVRCSVFVSRSTVRVEHLKPFPVGRDTGGQIS